MHRLASCSALASAALFTLGACGISIDFDGPATTGSGNIITEERSVGEFDTVSIAGSIDTDIRVGSEASVTITGDDNILPLIETEILERQLRIDRKQRYHSRHGIKIVVTTPRLRGVSASGSSDVRVTGVAASAFDVNVTGSSDMTVGGEFGDLDVSVSGSGDLDMWGAADFIAVSVSGSADVDMSEVTARAGEVSVSGSGDVSVNVTDELDASVSGSGNIEYTGQPRVRQSVHGSGSIRGRG